MPNVEQLLANSGTMQGGNVAGLLDALLPTIVEALAPEGLQAGPVASNLLQTLMQGGYTTAHPMKAMQQINQEATMEAAMENIAPAMVEKVSGALEQAFQAAGVEEPEELSQNITAGLQSLGLLESVAGFISPGGTNADFVRGATAPGGFAQQMRSRGGTTSWSGADVAMFSENMERYFYGEEGMDENFSRTRGLDRDELMQVANIMADEGAFTRGTHRGPDEFGGMGDVMQQQAEVVADTSQWARVVQAAKTVFGEDEGIPSLLQDVKDLMSGPLTAVDPAEMENALYRMRTVSDALGNTIEGTAEFVKDFVAQSQTVTQTAFGNVTTQYYQGAQGVNAALDVMATQQALRDTGALTQLSESTGLSETEITSQIAGQTTGVRSSMVGRELAAIAEFGQIATDEQISNMGEDAQRAVEIVREMQTASPAQRQQLSTELGQLRMRNPALGRQVLQGLGIQGREAETILASQEYARGEAGEMVQGAAQAARREDVLNQILTSATGETLYQTFQRFGGEDVTMMDVEEYLTSTTGMDEEAQRQYLQEKYGLDAAQAAQFQTSLQATTGEISEQYRVELATGNMDVQRRKAEQQAQAEAQAAMAEISGGKVKRYDSASFFSRILGEGGEEMTFSDIMQAAGILADPEELQALGIEYTDEYKSDVGRLQQMESQLQSGVIQELSADERQQFMREYAQTRSRINNVNESMQRHYYDKKEDELLREYYGEDTELEEAITLNVRDPETGEMVERTFEEGANVAEVAKIAMAGGDPGAIARLRRYRSDTAPENLDIRPGAEGAPEDLTEEEETEYIAVRKRIEEGKGPQEAREEAQEIMAQIAKNLELTTKVEIEPTRDITINIETPEGTRTETVGLKAVSTVSRAGRDD